MRLTACISRSRCRQLISVGNGSRALKQYPQLRLLSSMASSTTANEAPPAHVINFGCGHPDASLLPMQLVADATQHALAVGTATSNTEWLQYARENGSSNARAAIASFLTRLYYPTSDDSSVVHPDTLCLTSGVSHGIQLTCRTLLRRHNATAATQQDPQERPLCLVEDPTYFLVPAIFQQSGYDVQAVATTASCGMNVDQLQDTLQKLRASSLSRLIVLYTIPVHHNPLGVTLPEEDRVRLVQLCEEYKVHLIVDEVYQGLGFPDTADDTIPSPAPMALRSPNVIAVSAFTKILCPGIRCGWIQTLDLDLLLEIGKDAVLDSGGCSSQLSSGIITSMLDKDASMKESPLESYMMSLQTEYAKRCHHLCQELSKASSRNDFGFDFCIPKGGYFLWVQLTGLDFVVDEAFRIFCQTRYDVDFKTGASCTSANSSVDDNEFPFPQSLRLCFAYYDTPTLTLGVERLLEAIQTYSKNLERS